MLPLIGFAYDAGFKKYFKSLFDSHESSSNIYQFITFTIDVSNINIVPIIWLRMQHFFGRMLKVRPSFFYSYLYVRLCHESVRMFLSK